MSEPLKHAYLINHLDWLGLDNIPKFFNPFLMKSKDMHNRAPFIIRIHSYAKMNLNEIPIENFVWKLEVVPSSPSSMN